MLGASIIIPAYNQTTLTLQCLDTLLREDTASLTSEIIVVDDGSTDGLAKRLATYGERIRVVTHRETMGFAIACNDGANVASGEYLVFLNNDTMPLSGWLQALVMYADRHPRAAVVGSKLLYPDDTVQHAGIVFDSDHFPQHIYKGISADHPVINRSRCYQAVTAACMLVRRKPFLDMKGFDREFVNEFEDVDLCLRLGAQGHEVHYCHESALYHLESATRDRSASTHGMNRRLYRARWGERVQQDDLQFYIEDGLLRCSYEEEYLTWISAELPLAVVATERQQQQLTRLLRVRSQQVYTLTREVLRLTTLLGSIELQPRSQAAPRVRRTSPNVEQTGTLRELVARLSALNDTARSLPEPAATIIGDDRLEMDWRTLLIDAHQQLLMRDASLQDEVHQVQTTLATLLQERGTTKLTRSFTPNSNLGYQQAMRRMREVVEATIPTDTVVLVVSKGDEMLLDLGRRRAWHFPRGDDGEYAGYYPADSADAIAHLEQLRSNGAQYFVLPSTAFWWLEYYRDFRAYLETHYGQAVHESITCIIFELKGESSPGGQSARLVSGIPLDADAVASERPIADLMRALLPPHATVVVAASPSRTLSELSGMQVHFWSPAEKIATVAQLDALRSEGATFLVFPSEIWSQIRRNRAIMQYLGRFKVLTNRPNLGVIYDLHEN